MNQQSSYNQPMGNQSMGTPQPKVSKWLWIILIIVALAGGGFFAWYFLMGPGKATTSTATTTTSVKTDPTANWKTFSDTINVYSIKYPADYTLKSETTSSLILGSESFLAPGETDSVVSFNIAVKDLEAYATSVTGFTDKTLAGYVKSISPTQTQTTSTVDGQPATTVTKANPDDTTKTMKVTYVLKTGKIYEITENYLTTDKTIASIYSTMLGTFKFTTATATTSATSTVNWKTYSNTRVGYQYKYPATGVTLPPDETIKYPSTSASDAKDEDLVQFATATNTYAVRTKVGVTETTIEDWIKNIDAVGKKDIANYTKTTIGGKTAYTDKTSLFSYVMSGSNVYQITDNKGSAPETASDSIYQNWLSTFTFTK